jgi:hypothetical protein
MDHRSIAIVNAIKRQEEFQHEKRKRSKLTEGWEQFTTTMSWYKETKLSSIHGPLASKMVQPDTRMISTFSENFRAMSELITYKDQVELSILSII